MLVTVVSNSVIPWTEIQSMGFLQARILDWVAKGFSSGSSLTQASKHGSPTPQEDSLPSELPGKPKPEHESSPSEAQSPLVPRYHATCPLRLVAAEGHVKLSFLSISCMKLTSCSSMHDPCPRKPKVIATKLEFGSMAQTSDG